MAACGHGGAMKQLMIGRRVAMLSLFVLSACAGSTKPAEAPHALLGKAAPELSGGDVPGSPSASFSRDGTVVIVDFWATHCGPCVKAFPKLQALEQRHAGKVRVIGVSPGAILWPEGGEAFPPAERERITVQTPLRRTGTPEDIAGAVKYFLFDAPFVTGQVLAVDGGRSLAL